MDRTFYSVILLLCLFMVRGANGMSRTVMSLLVSGPRPWADKISFPLFSWVPKLLGCLLTFYSSSQKGSTGTPWEARHKEAHTAFREHFMLFFFFFLRTGYQPLSRFEITTLYIFKNTIQLIEKSNKSSRLLGELILACLSDIEVVFHAAWRPQRLSILLSHKEEAEPCSVTPGCSQALVFLPVLSELPW